MPSKYLIEHFEFLKGFRELSGDNYDNEFYLDPNKQVRIKYTDYEKADPRQLPKDPNKIIYYYNN